LILRIAFDKQFILRTLLVTIYQNNISILRAKIKVKAMIFCNQNFLFLKLKWYCKQFLFHGICAVIFSLPQCLQGTRETASETIAPDSSSSIKSLNEIIQKEYKLLSNI